MIVMKKRILNSGSIRLGLLAVFLMASSVAVELNAQGTPDTAKTPILKLSAKSLKGKIEDKGDVKEWPAIIGPALVYTQSKEFTPPLFSESSPTGAPAVYFPPKSCLGINGFSQKYLAAKSFTVFVRCIPVTRDFGIGGNGLMGSGGVPRLYLCPTYFIYNQNESNIANPPAKFLNQVGIFVYYYNAAEKTMKYFMNGTLLNEKKDIAPVERFTGGCLAIPLLVGGKQQEGYLFDLIIFDQTLSDDEIAKVAAKITE